MFHNLTSLPAVVRSRETATSLSLLGLGVVFSLLSPYFLTISNLVNVVQQSAIIAIIAAGMTFVIIGGGIDLSVGSLVAVSGLVMADLLHASVPVPLAVGVALLVGFTAGCVNGVLIAYAKLPPFIATLGTMSVARGGALMYASGGSISGFDANFRFLANEALLGVPFPVIVMVIVFAAGHFLLTQTRMGRYTYAIGGNEMAAVLAGINVGFFKTMIYGICGMLSGLAAVLLTARLNSAQSIAGTMYELDAIAAAVIGGSSLLGGRGTMLGTFLGALIMGVLRNGLNLLNVSSYVQQVAIGSVIIVAVFIDLLLKRKINPI